MESLAAVIRSFNAASAGFVFEGFLAALFRGRQEAEVSEKGNLPIQDLIAFSELGDDDDERAVPVSLKLLNQTTNIEGSYTNLVDALDEFGHMVYIVARKDKDKIALEKFTFTRDNFIDAISLTARGGRSKEKDLFRIPELEEGDECCDKSLEELSKLQGDANWPQKYELLQLTAGYRNRKEKPQAPDDTVTVSDEVPDGTDIPQEEEPTKENKTYSVAQNRQLLSEGAELLLESSTQWAISPSQLVKVANLVDYETLGTLPITTEAVVNVATQYIDLLSDNLQNIFEATANLSTNINEYFTYEDRSQAIDAGTEAIKDSQTITKEMKTQVSDRQKPPGNVKENTVLENKRSSRRVALFPGKFKPPHRGHLEYVTNLAQRPDVSEVKILISPIDKPEVSKEQSLAIWNKYLEGAPDNIGVDIADYRSPVTAVYEFLKDPTATEPGDTVLLIKSTKDADSGDTRFKGAQAWAERENPQIKVEEIAEEPVNRPDGSPYNGEDAREAIDQKNKELFSSFVPDSSPELTNQIWNILFPNDDFQEEVDDMIDEMTTVGSVGSMGYSIPLGDKPNYPKPSQSRKTPKRKKPKVNRGKRQRRR
jgi:hypothetical protein